VFKTLPISNILSGWCWKWQHLMKVVVGPKSAVPWYECIVFIINDCFTGNYFTLGMKCSVLDVAIFVGDNFT